MKPAQRLDAERIQLQLFSAVVTAVSRGLQGRDALMGVTKSLRQAAEREEFFFDSGQRSLAAAYVAGNADSPAILICHGIGETVEHWSGVQALLKDAGIGSLVFNYSGYGASSGRVAAEHFEQDMTAAYAELSRRLTAGNRLFVLGFSLGSGIVASGAGRLEPPPSGLILCEAYTSFREASHAAGFPRLLAGMVPPLWETCRNVQQLEIPVCVVHSDADRLFPLNMAAQIFRSCAGTGSQFIPLSGFSHNELYARPSLGYWGPIVDWMMRIGGESKILEAVE